MLDEGVAAYFERLQVFRLQVLEDGLQIRKGPALLSPFVSLPGFYPGPYVEGIPSNPSDLLNSDCSFSRQKMVKIRKRRRLQYIFSPVNKMVHMDSSEPFACPIEIPPEP